MSVFVQKKRDTSFLVQSGDGNENFWYITYPEWENETFDVFARHCRKDACMLDFGTWIGPTVLYNANKCKHIYGVEADRKSIQSIQNNIAVNRFENITIVPKAIFNETGRVNFGKNTFLS